MKKVPMLANKDMYFDGKDVKKDEPFESEERFVNILELSKSARRDEVKRKYKRRDMVAESP